MVPPAVLEVSEREYRRAESLVGFEENDTGQRSRAKASTTRSGDVSHSTHPKVNAAKASKKVGQTSSSGTKTAMKSSREAKFRNYLNTDGTLDKLTRALDDLLRSNVKPDSPSDWLVARLSDDYSNKLKEAQEDLEEQVKENEKLKERLDKSRSFVHRLQEDVEDLTKKLEEEKEMAEAVAARAMHEPQGGGDVERGVERGDGRRERDGGFNPRVRAKRRRALGGAKREERVARGTREGVWKWNFTESSVVRRVVEEIDAVRRD